MSARGPVETAAAMRFLEELPEPRRGRVLAALAEIERILERYGKEGADALAVCAWLALKNHGIWRA